MIPRAQTAFLALALLALPAFAAPHPAPLYLLATTSSSQGLGLESGQTGAELGGRIPISRSVEAWWSTSWATAPKIDADGTGEQIDVAFEVDGHLGRGWWLGGGLGHGRIRTSHYEVVASGAHVVLSRRWGWGVVSGKLRVDDSERHTRSLGAGLEMAAGRLLIRIEATQVWFDLDGPREGIRIRLGFGVALSSLSGRYRDGYRSPGRE